MHVDHPAEPSLAEALREAARESEVDRANGARRTAEEQASDLDGLQSTLVELRGCADVATNQDEGIPSDALNRLIKAVSATLNRTHQVLHETEDRQRRLDEIEVRASQDRENVSAALEREFGFGVGTIETTGFGRDPSAEERGRWKAGDVAPPENVVVLRRSTGTQQPQLRDAVGQGCGALLSLPCIRRASRSWGPSYGGRRCRPDEARTQGGSGTPRISGASAP